MELAATSYNLSDPPDVKAAIAELEELRREANLDNHDVAVNSLKTIPMAEDDSSGDETSGEDTDEAAGPLQDVYFPPKLSYEKKQESPFPPACLFFLRLFPGNDICMDCGDFSPYLVLVEFGILLCTRCSERHMSLGRSVSVPLSKHFHDAAVCSSTSLTAVLRRC